MRIAGFKCKMTPEKNSSIRKEVNMAISKVAKNFFQVGLATSMILGAPACVPTETISTIPTGEINPLPGDSTKTAESPTEATYEVTSTPGIESTINPPTEVATETATPEDFVTVEFKSDNLDENIKAWQEGKIDYQLMEVTEEGWGKGLGLVVDEDKTKTKRNEYTNAYFFQGVYLGRETIKLKMNEEMANPENISLPDEYINSSRLNEDLLVTFNKAANRVIDGFPNGIKYGIVFVGMENGLVIPLSMGYEVEGKDIIKEQGLPTKKCPEVTNGKFPTKGELSWLECPLVNGNTSFVNVKTRETIAFELEIFKEYGFTFFINTIESRPINVIFNFFSIMSGQDSNSQEMVNGNLDFLAVNSDKNINWQQLYTMPYVTRYFTSKK